MLDGAPVSFLEARNFTRRVEELLSDDEYRQLQNVLIQAPRTGTVIRDTGGARKLRWAGKGHGKSGGVRVIYAAVDVAPLKATVCYMLLIYPKGEQDSLSADQKKQLKILIEGLKAEANSKHAQAIKSYKKRTTGGGKAR